MKDKRTVEKRAYRKVARCFTKKEWRKIPEIQRKNMINRYLNYCKMLESGLTNAKPPGFMCFKMPKPVPVKTKWAKMRRHGIRL